MPPIAAPTPIPAFAAVERGLPVDVEEEVAAVAEAVLATVCDVALGCADEELVDKTLLK